MPQANPDSAYLHTVRTRQHGIIGTLITLEACEDCTAADIIAIHGSCAANIRPGTGHFTYHLNGRCLRCLCNSRPEPAPFTEGNKDTETHAHAEANAYAEAS